jgi:hypothetical protein
MSFLLSANCCDEFVGRFQSRFRFARDSCGHGLQNIASGLV